MPLHSGERAGIGGAVRAVADRAGAIVRLELQLAAAELRHKVAALGVGIGLAAAAVVFGFFALLFAVATAAAALALVVSVWLALLIMTATTLAVAGVLAAFGISRIRKGSLPVPTRALEEARLTTQVLRNGKE